MTGRTLRVAMLAALSPRERLTPSQWAERYRYLSAEETSEPGRWRNDRAPYLADLMDLAADPAVEELVVLKGAQIGWSEVCRNCLAYWIDLDPGPCLMVCASEKAAADQKEERVDPLIKHTPAIAAHVTDRRWDNKTARVKFDTMTLHFAWSGSSQGVKSRPIRYLILEEPDEFAAESGAGGDPIAKAEKRLTTYSDKGRAKKLIGGTPTTRTGNMMRRWDACADRRYYHVPCPHCGAYQRLKWAGVKWPDPTETDRPKQANKIETERLAYYECEHCHQHIHDHDKPAMLRKRRLVSEGQAIDAAGNVTGPRPPSRRVGVFVPSMYSPWVSFSTLAAEWLLAQADPQALRDFINQRLAEPFETITSQTTATTLDEKAVGAPPALVVPSWARRLIATADTQGADEASGYFYYVIRAWGYGWRSQLIDAGLCSTKEELIETCLKRQIRVEGGGHAAPSLLLVDSGGPRWQEVYSLSLNYRNHVHPTKGANTSLQFMVDKKPQRDHGIVLWFIDTQQSKDQLHALIHHEDRSLWTVNDRVPPDYFKHLRAEQKVLLPKGKEVWQKRPGDPPNHYLDCEHQQVAAAWQEGCQMTEPPPQPKPEFRAEDMATMPRIGGYQRW